MPRVQSDPLLLHQVFLNIMMNAEQSIAATGKPGRIEISSTRADGRVITSVRDTGSGIPEEALSRIFEPFYTTKEVGKGTGLGLSTVHAIVKSHGGFVQVQSELNVGTTFKVFLPADPSLHDVQPAPAVVELPRGRNELVLVVDDEAAIRQITQQTLEMFGYRVHVAGDGAAAAAYYATHAREIGVVLTDMMMPVMDGSATIQVLFRLNPAAKIIATSGLNANENVAKAAALGAKHFLPKPYTAETLLRIIREVLDRAPAPKNSSSKLR
jgi:CheY-like chemotaxis protein